MLGKSMISANLNGQIGYQDKQTIILYSPQESARRMEEYKAEKLANAKTEGKIEEEEPENLEEVSSSENQEPAVEEEHEKAKEEEPAKGKIRRKRTKQMKIDDLPVGE